MSQGLEITMTLTQIGPANRSLNDVLRKSGERPVIAADEKALRNTTSMTAPAWKPWSQEPALDLSVGDIWELYEQGIQSLGGRP